MAATRTRYSFCLIDTRWDGVCLPDIRVDNSHVSKFGQFSVLFDCIILNQGALLLVFWFWRCRKSQTQVRQLQDDAANFAPLGLCKVPTLCRVASRDSSLIEVFRLDWTKCIHGLCVGLGLHEDTLRDYHALKPRKRLPCNQTGSVR